MTLAIKPHSQSIGHQVSERMQMIIFCCHHRNTLVSYQTHLVFTLLQRKTMVTTKLIFTSVPNTSKQSWCMQCINLGHEKMLIEDEGYCPTWSNSEVLVARRSICLACLVFCFAQITIEIVNFIINVNPIVRTFLFFL